ncbi:ABC transporter substrate-binding protein [Oxalobacteraceae bacterium]|nr:ABC transporter substrate-binding protein [Oxalobacteraceae bacterium]
MGSLLSLFPSGLRALSAALLACACGAAAALDVLVLDRPESRADHRRDFASLVLRTVMERTVPEFGRYRIEQAAVYMNRRRLFEALKEGKFVNVAAYPASQEWMDALRSVQVPIDMGLQSWRLLLIDGDKQVQFRTVQSLEQLQRWSAGTGGGGITLKALRENGLPVVTGGSYPGLFQMLMAGRFDYFPRGLNEIFSEYDHFRASYPALAVENSLLLHQQVVSLFFVSPRAQHLQRRLTLGMEAMVRDGTLERLVLSYFKADLQRAALCGRTRLELASAPLAPAMYARKELWIDPADPRHGVCPAPPRDKH